MSNLVQGVSITQPSPTGTRTSKHSSQVLRDWIPTDTSVGRSFLPPVLPLAVTTVATHSDTKVHANNNSVMCIQKLSAEPGSGIPQKVWSRLSATCETCAQNGNLHRCGVARHVRQVNVRETRGSCRLCAHMCEHTGALGSWDVLCREPSLPVFTRMRAFTFNTAVSASP